eukprot:s1828_g17.t1
MESQRSQSLCEFVGSEVTAFLPQLAATQWISATDGPCETSARQRRRDLPTLVERQSQVSTRFCFEIW